MGWRLVMVCWGARCLTLYFQRNNYKYRSWHMAKSLTRGISCFVLCKQRGGTPSCIRGKSRACADELCNDDCGLMRRTGEHPQC